MPEKAAPALIFAAGFGTRMGALTEKMPKPMIELCGKPMIDHTVDLLHAAGIDQIVANTHYLSNVITPHLTGLGVAVSHETPDILDTGGGLRHASHLLDSDRVITINPDAAWHGPNPIETLINAWRPEMDALLLVVPEERARARTAPGDFALENGRLTRRGTYVYTGAQIINPDLTRDIPDKAFSLNIVWNKLIETDTLYGVSYEGEWCDIGHPDGLNVAESMMRGASV